MGTASGLFIVKSLEIAKPLKQVGTSIWKDKWIQGFTSYHGIKSERGKQ